MLGKDEDRESEDMGGRNKDHPRLPAEPQMLGARTGTCCVSGPHLLPPPWSTKITQFCQLLDLSSQGSTVSRL